MSDWDQRIKAAESKAEATTQRQLSTTERQTARMAALIALGHEAAALLLHHGVKPRTHKVVHRTMNGRVRAKFQLPVSWFLHPSTGTTGQSFWLLPDGSWLLETSRRSRWSSQPKEGAYPLRELVKTGEVPMSAFELITDTGGSRLTIELLKDEVARLIVQQGSSRTDAAP